MDVSLQKTNLGKKIRFQRLQAGLSQDDLVANRYSKSYLSRVESDQVVPSEDFLTYIAERLGVAVSDILATNVEGSLLKARVTKAGSLVESNKEEQELDLKNITIALFKKDWEEATKFIAKLDPTNLHEDILPEYYSLKGQLYFEQGDYVAAIIELEHALEFYEDRRNPPIDIERVRHLLGQAYYRQDNFIAAIEYYERCWQAIKDGKIEDLFFKIKIYSNLGNAYYALNKTEQALKLYKDAAKLAQEVNSKESLESLASIYWGIGLTYRAKGHIPFAKLYLDKSANLYKEIDNAKFVGTVRGMLGVILADDQQYEEAIQALSSARAIAESLNDVLNIARSLVNLAYLYLQRNDLTKAAELAEEGVHKAREAGNKLTLGQSLAQLGDIKLAENNIEECLQCYEEGQELLRHTGAKEYLKRFYSRYAQALVKAGKVNEALAMYQKATDYNNSSHKELF